MNKKSGIKNAGGGGGDISWLVVFTTVRQVLILGWAFKQERLGGKTGGGRDPLQYVRGNYKSLKGTNLTITL